jgi:hypothetical protein
MFQDALEQPADERGRFLRSSCGDDRELQSEVESLLVAHVAARSFAQGPRDRGVAALGRCRASGGASGRTTRLQPPALVHETYVRLIGQDGRDTLRGVARDCFGRQSRPGLSSSDQPSCLPVSCPGPGESPDELSGRLRHSCNGLRGRNTSGGGSRSLRPPWRPFAQQQPLGHGTFGRLQSVHPRRGWSSETRVEHCTRRVPLGHS